ncbi:hypothetical protein HMPREF9569_02507, partial [Cutibacterium acnes HL078PA1]
SSRYFLTTGNAERFEKLGRRLMEGFVHDVQSVHADAHSLGDRAVVRD